MTTSLWLAEERPPPVEKRVDGHVDVAIVGGGVTGCACAHVLVRAGLRVRLHEAREIAGGASGRNGGFALRGGAPAYDAAREQLDAYRFQRNGTGTLRHAEDVWVSVGYSGHGNVMGLACGELVARAILGDAPPELELFEPARLVSA